MKNLKKIISIIVCIALMLSLTSIAFAEDTLSSVVTNTDDTNLDGTNTDDTNLDGENNEQATVIHTDIKVVVNGVPVAFYDVNPIIEDGRTLVPLRKVGEAINAEVAWRAIDNTVHLFRDGLTVKLTIGKPDIEIYTFDFADKFVYTSNAVNALIDPNQPSVIAKTINDRTMIPIRAVAEIYGGKVSWDNANSTVVIEIPAYAPKRADKNAARYIETWNYTPAVELKTAKVTVKVNCAEKDFDPAILNGIVIAVNDVEQTTVEGTCAFDKVEVGSATIKISNEPAGYTVDDHEIKINVDGDKTINITLKAIEQ